jgi:hypothetical protein
VYETRYDRNVLTNEGGSWNLVTLATNLTSWGGAHELAFDGAGTLHSRAGSDYRTKPPSGTFASETLPAGLGASGDRAIAIDKNGALVIAWTSGGSPTQTVSLSRRTGASTWSTDSAPMMSAVATGSSGTVVDLFGLAFDATNRAFVLMSDGLTYRSVVKAP